MPRTRALADDVLDVEEETADAEPAVTYEIAAYPSDLTLGVIYKQWSDRDIFLPEFQRQYVWTIQQASLLIESFLLGLPVPQIFLYVDEENRYQVVDGQQRIVSIVYYFDGYFGTENQQGRRQVFRLTGLNEKSPFYKKRFSDLADSDRRRLEGAVLRAVNIRQLKPGGEPTSIYHIFERLNTGGTPLKPQEIRNCVYRGPIVKALQDLNKDGAWRKILSKQAADRFQKDVELILRIYALAYWLDEYEKPMKEFLNIIMERERQASSTHYRTFRERFPVTAATIVHELGDHPFHLRGRLNSSALDAVFGVLLTAGGLLPNDLANRYAELKSDKRFVTGTTYSTSDVAVVKARFELTRERLLK